MSASVSDFKRKVQESTKVPAWGKASPSASAKASPQPQATASSSKEPPPDGTPAKKKKHKADVVWSQPADTGSGVQRGTQLAFALDYLKKSVNPIRLEDLAIYSQVPALLTYEGLRTAFNNDPNVNINPNNGLYSWKREYQSRTPEQLLQEIRTRGRDGGGLSIKQLKEGFPDVVTHIEELEKQGSVLVTRNPKDNAPKYVFWNEITEEQGGRKVEDEFRTLWDELVNPVEADLIKALEKDGLQATASEAVPVPQVPKKKSKKAKTGNRNHKVTNDHVQGSGVDLTVDYVPARS